MRSHESPSANQVQRVRSCIGQLRVRTKFWLEADGAFVIGEHGLVLLQSIHEKGSLAEAARVVGWSYRHAWGYVRRAEQALGVTLLETRPGRGSKRGAALSRDGRALIRFGKSLRGKFCYPRNKSQKFDELADS